MNTPPIQPPMTGSWLVQVQDVRPFTIHGDQYYELQVLRQDDPGSGLIVLRIPSHAASGEPSPGDNLMITFLMGQVTSAKLVV